MLFPASPPAPEPDPGIEPPPAPPSQCIGECHAGASRWCHLAEGCLWGTQRCGDDQSWGGCVASTGRPSGCEGYGEFDRACCDAATDACCENYPDVGSLGECAGIVLCWDPL